MKSISQHFQFLNYFQLGFYVPIDYQFVLKSNLVIVKKKISEKVLVSNPIPPPSMFALKEIIKSSWIISLF